MLRAWLKELRLSKKLTQEELSSKLGIAQTLYSKIENGDRQKDMNLSIASAIASTFKISLKRVNEYEKLWRESEKNARTYSDIKPNG
jgi:transcriptional regulator with XRE-family HTH domain